MPTIFRRRPWTRRPSRRYWVPYSAGVVTEFITVDKDDLVITAQNVTEAESTLITHQSLVITGQAVTEIENEIVDKDDLVITEQDVLDNDVIGITHQSLVLTGQTVSLIDSEATPIDPDTLTLTGQTITDTDVDSISITHQALAITSHDVGSIEIVPQGGVMAGGGGGGLGPASDGAYKARRQYLQDKRDREERLWTGKPANDTDNNEKPSQATTEVKETDTSPPEPEGPDLDSLIEALMVPSVPFVPPPRPQRFFNPEDDLDVVLLTDF